MVYCRGKFEYGLSPINAVPAFERRYKALGDMTNERTFIRMYNILQSTSQYKQCSSCGEKFPATKDFFYSNKGKIRDLGSNCKTCVRVLREQRTHHDPLPGETKQCSKCKESFPATNVYFVRNNQQRDRLHPSCKRCQGNKNHGIEPAKEGMKRCSKCREEFPATNAYFVTDLSQSSGLYPACKKCQGKKTHGIELFKRGIDEDEKQCTKCRIWKPFSEFGASKYTSDKITSECKDCHNTRITKKRTSPRSRTQWLRYKYGITVEQYDRMLEEQGGVCKICKREETHVDPQTKKVRPLVVDHDHKTGDVRALLCTACNTALGMMSEDPDRIRVLVEYAEWCKSRGTSSKIVQATFEFNTKD